MKCGTDIQGIQMMPPKYIGDTLTFHVAAPMGQSFS